LYQNLLVESELASDVSMWVDANRLATIINIEATAKSGVAIEKVEAELNRTLRELASKGPTARELRRAQRKILLDIYEDLEALNGDDGESGRAGLLQRLHHYTSGTNQLSAWLATLRRVTATDVAKVVSSWLKETQSATIITLPRAPGALKGGSQP
jgi:predicted Zn-dependent peptidase